MRNGNRKNIYILGVLDVQENYIMTLKDLLSNLAKIQLRLCF